MDYSKSTEYENLCTVDRDQASYEVFNSRGDGFNFAAAHDSNSMSCVAMSIVKPDAVDANQVFLPVRAVRILSAAILQMLDRYGIRHPFPQHNEMCTIAWDYLRDNPAAAMEPIFVAVPMVNSSIPLLFNISPNLSGLFTISMMWRDMPFISSETLSMGYVHTPDVSSNYVEGFSVADLYDASIRLLDMIKALSGPKKEGGPVKQQVTKSVAEPRESAAYATEDKSTVYVKTVANEQIHPVDTVIGTTITSQAFPSASTTLHMQSTPVAPAAPATPVVAPQYPADPQPKAPQTEPSFTFVAKEEPENEEFAINIGDAHTGSALDRYMTDMVDGDQ